MARPKIRRRVDAIALLKSDHRKVEKLFKQFEKSRDKRAKARLAREICIELSVHTTIEEVLFYPAVRKAVEKEMYEEAYVEHDGAKVLIAELRSGKPSDDFYDAKVKVLAEMIKHHVKEEEQRDGLFAQAKRSKLDFADLGSRMLMRKQQLAAKMKKSGVPKPATRSMKGADLKRARPIA